MSKNALIDRYIRDTLSGEAIIDNWNDTEIQLQAFTMKNGKLTATPFDIPESIGQIATQVPEIIATLYLFVLVHNALPADVTDAAEGAEYLGIGFFSEAWGLGGKVPRGTPVEEAMRIMTKELEPYGGEVKNHPDAVDVKTVIVVDRTGASTYSYPRGATKIDASEEAHGPVSTAMLALHNTIAALLI